MTTTTKVFPQMRGVNAKITELQAAGVDAPKRRLAAIQAAAISSNKRTAGAYKSATAGLAKLGFSIDQIAASGSIADIEAKMEKHRWTTTQKIALKMSLGIVGAI